MSEEKESIDNFVAQQKEMIDIIGGDNLAKLMDGRAKIIKVTRQYTKEEMPKVIFVNIDSPDSGWWTGFEGSPKDFVRYAREDVQDAAKPNEDLRQTAVKSCLRFIHDINQNPELVREAIKNLETLLWGLK